MVKSCLIGGLVLALTLGSSGARANDCPGFVWSGIINPGPQVYWIDNRYETPSGGKVIEVHWGPLAGRYGKVYSFIEFRGNFTFQAVTAGSYEFTVMLHAEDYPEDRMYHFDHYTHEWHETLGFYLGRPEIEPFRARALEILGVVDERKWEGD